MRRIFIIFGFAAFLLYCWASVAFQNQVKVPGYRLVQVDILGDGKTRERWDADRQGQFRRLMELENAKYQLPESAGTSDGSRPLESADFERMIAALAPNQGLVMELRDASAVYDLANRGYVLRDPVMRPGDGPRQEPLFYQALPVDKDLIDGLIANGIGTVTVTGRAPPVNFEAGTSLMVAIIFFTLLAALKPVLWDPFRVMLDRRRKELQMGGEAARQNQVEEARLEDTRKKANADMLREVDGLRSRQDREIGEEAGDIVRGAREKERETKLEGLRRIVDSADEARAGLRDDIPSLAEAIADALTPGRTMNNEQ